MTLHMGLDAAATLSTGVERGGEGAHASAGTRWQLWGVPDTEGTSSFTLSLKAANPLAVRETE